MFHLNWAILKSHNVAHMFSSMLFFHMLSIYDVSFATSGAIDSLIIMDLIFMLEL